MKREIRRCLLVLAASALITACGGGGDGGGGSTPAANKTVALSGVATQSSGVAGAAETSLTGAKVTVKSFDSSGTLKETVEAVTGAGGGFNVNVTAQGGGGTISVRVENAGTTAFEKSFIYKTAAELAAGLQVAAKLDPVAMKVVAVNVAKPEIGFDKSAIAGDMVSIAVMENAKGVKSIVSNSQIAAAKAAGNTVTWQLDVAKVLFAAAGTQSVTVKAQNYNPANPNDMTRFPTDSTDTGDKLVSASFDFIDIKDQDGKPLAITKSAAKTARKSAAVAYAVRKQIPDCGLILKDENATKPGVQIGFYFMRSGKWQKLGEATLYDDVGSATTNPVLHTLGACSGAAMPYAVLTDADVSKDIDFDLKWFNFDYVAFGNFKTDCVEGKFSLTKADGTTVPLGGSSFYFDTLSQGNAKVAGFQSASGYTVQDGTFKLDFRYGDVTLNNPTAKFTYTDPYTWLQTSKTATLSTKNSNGCYSVADMVVTEPKCSVTGTIFKSDGTTPAVGRSVQIYQAGSYGGYYAYTNALGVYSAQVDCDIDYKLYVDGITKSINVNNTVSADEKSDNDVTVTVKDVIKANNAPSVYAYADNTSVAVNNGVNLSGYAGDPDGDTLSYGWTATCGTFMDPGKTVGSATSSLASTRWISPAAIPANNICTVTFTATDPGNKSASANVELYVSGTGNRPPIISSLYVPQAVKAGNSTQLSVYAYDANSADTLSYSWTSTCGSLAGAATAAPTFTAPAAAGSCNVTVNVTDNAATPLTTSKTSTVTINANRAPVISYLSVPTPVSPGATANLYVSAYDLDYDTVSYLWSATCGTFTGGATANPVYTAPTTPGSCTVKVAVSDGTSTNEQSRAVTISNQAPQITGVTVPAAAYTNGKLTLAATATDANSSDTLTWGWSIVSGGGSLGAGCSGTGTSSVTSSCSYTAPASAASVVLRFSVSDGSNSAVTSDKTVVVTVPAQGDGVTITVQ